VVCAVKSGASAPIGKGPVLIALSWQRLEREKA
jgi:hypothetical protein